MEFILKKSLCNTKSPNMKTLVLTTKVQYEKHFLQNLFQFLQRSSRLCWGCRHLGTVPCIFSNSKTVRKLQFLQRNRQSFKIQDSFLSEIPLGFKTYRNPTKQSLINLKAALASLSDDEKRLFWKHLAFWIFYWFLNFVQSSLVRNFPSEEPPIMYS